MRELICPECGLGDQAGNYCVRCGADLRAAPASRRRFAAAPHEGSALPRLVSTLYPHLPRSSMAGFRTMLGFGVGVIVALALAGLFPVALVAAAVLVPLITVLYLYDVDLYEDEPVRVIAFTMAWGLATGIGVGFMARSIGPSGSGLVTASTASIAWWRGIFFPLLSLVLMIAGPLVLLPYHKFNDVLDGATFGGATAVTFFGARIVTEAVPFLRAGLRPVGAAVPWVYRLLQLGVAIPVLAAAAVGGATGALWLRFRAPVGDRKRLGVLGQPVVAVAAAGLLLITGGLAEGLVSPGYGLLALVGLDLFGLAWLRRTLHLGLLEEASEIPVGPDITCPNCGHPTPGHSFCANCGVSLRALPKERPIAGEPGTSPAVGGA